MSPEAKSSGDLLPSAIVEKPLLSPAFLNPQCSRLLVLAFFEPRARREAVPYVQQLVRAVLLVCSRT